MQVSDREIGALIQKVETLTEMVGELNKRIGELEGVANRGKGFLLGVFLVAGGIGSAVTMAVQNVFGK